MSRDTVYEIMANARNKTFAKAENDRAKQSLARDVERLGKENEQLKEGIPDEKLQNLITKMRCEVTGQPLFDEQTFYEGAIWYREQLYKLKSK